MSTRGLKYDFMVGEFVLCFEPDPTKAKVLYDAKVLDLQSLRDKDGKKIPGYHIHFQGWNSSWDRIVSEEFILKGTEENRLLMKTLAETAKKNQTKDNRKRKIDDILKRAFDGGDLSSSDGDSSTSRKGLDSDDEDDEDESKTDDENSPTKESPDAISNDPTLPQQPTHSPVDVEIPEILKTKLEDDFFLINHKEKLVKLPVRPNIIEILEGFVKSYCLNNLYDQPERDKSRSNSSDSWHFAPGRWIPLCKEMVDGIRICFDFTLPLILLYGNERDQYKDAVRNITYHTLQEQDRVLTPTDQNTKRPRKISPHQRFSHNVDLDSSSEDLTPRRITRKSITEETPRSAPRGRKPGPRSRRVQSTPVNRDIEIKVEPNSDNEISFNTSVQLSGDISTNKHMTVRNGNGLHHNHDNMQDGRSDIMDSLLSWQLLPTEIQLKEPIKPSQIYGVHHLLRLFVKLPSLVNSMNLDEGRTQILMKLVDSCLQYLAEREEIFHDEIYVDS
ncbi:male-specific lethal 3 homolog [Patella vulgata]|uniref:male-specific lethal 3 homolog n=1 Tax=Patella vulgata TaxID=6465 RepID=UPI0021803B5C|nr:male-specific lethal 3 homolog [Patella vulgata]